MPTKFYTPIAVTVIKFPPFRVHQQVKYPGFLRLRGRGGWGSNSILLFDHNRHLNLKELKKIKFSDGAEAF